MYIGDYLADILKNLCCWFLNINTSASIHMMFHAVGPMLAPAIWGMCIEQSKSVNTGHPVHLTDRYSTFCSFNICIYIPFLLF